MIIEDEAIDALKHIQELYDIMNSCNVLSKLIYENIITLILTLAISLSNKSIDEILIIFDLNYTSFLDDKSFILNVINYAEHYIAYESGYTSKSALYIDYILPLEKIKDAIMQFSN